MLKQRFRRFTQVNVLYTIQPEKILKQGTEPMMQARLMKTDAAAPGSVAEKPARYRFGGEDLSCV